MGVSMLLVVILLVVIIFILLFGAQAVKSGLANGCVMLILGAVLVGVLVVAQKMTAEQWWWFAGSVVLIVSAVWGYVVWTEKRALAETYGKDDGGEGFKTTLPKKPEPQSPLEILMQVFEEYDSRTAPATKVKARNSTLAEMRTVCGSLSKASVSATKIISNLMVNATADARIGRADAFKPPSRCSIAGSFRVAKASWLIPSALRLLRP